MPSAEWISKYFCWYFITALVQSNQVQGLVLLIMEAYSPGLRPLPNQSSTIWSSRLYPASLESLSNLAMYMSSSPLSILMVRNSAFAFCRLIVSVNTVLKESITSSYRCSSFLPAPARIQLPSHPTGIFDHSWTSGPLMKVRKSKTREKACLMMSCSPLSNLYMVHSSKKASAFERSPSKITGSLPLSFVPLFRSSGSLLAAGGGPLPPPPPPPPPSPPSPSPSSPSPFPNAR